MAKKKKKKPDAGEEAERIVAVIVQRLIDTGHVFKNKRKIISFVRAKKSDTLDSSGIDIIIIFDTFLALPLQIKKSLSRGHGKHRNKYPAIGHVFGVGELPKSDRSADCRPIARRLMKLINQALVFHNRPA